MKVLPWVEVAFVWGTVSLFLASVPLTGLLWVLTHKPNASPAEVTLAVRNQTYALLVFWIVVAFVFCAHPRIAGPFVCVGVYSTFVLAGVACVALCARAIKLAKIQRKLRSLINFNSFCLVWSWMWLLYLLVIF